MAYNKKTWGSDEVITKEALNNIENGIEAVEQSIPKLVSQLTNDAGYITEHLDLSNYAEKDELHEHNNKDVLDGINLVRMQSWDNAASKGDINLDDYALKSEIPEIPELPTKVSELENDLGYITEQVDLSNYVEKEELNNYVSKEAFEEYVNSTIKHIFITEEEYEALPEEDKNKEDVLYLITDGENIAINFDNIDNRISTLEEVEHVSLEQYNALLERITQLEEALAALSPSEPEEENPDEPEEPIE